MLSYDGLNELLKTKKITKTQIASILGISSRTMAKIGRGEPLSRGTIKKISDYLQCTPEDICRKVSPNVILQTLRDEKAAGISGGLYHELQVRMTYNSNHIEGSRLTEDQTRLIFETNTLNTGDGVAVDDILETVHHFRAIDYVIDHADDVLTAELIKQLHYILKHDTTDDRLPWFAVGDYKKRPNTIGGKETTRPEDVEREINALLDDYNAKKTIKLEDIVAFHAKFEQIHPFQDGNGRVGRLVALKECLRHNIVPFIIEDRKKMYYYRGLAEWGNVDGYLIGTCLDGQDTFKKLLEMFS
ncbi:MAG: Fic family protein [Clostridia bacterium]|nr:Fic family protein [Clostridia bacterium]